MTSFPYLLLKGDNPLKPFTGKNLWSNPTSEYERPTSRSSRHCSSDKTSNRKRVVSNFRTFTASQLQQLKLDIDPEIVHELPYKDHMIARNPPEKLDKLIKAIELEKNPNYPRFKYKAKRQENRDMRSYLDYLGSHSNRSVSTFRQRMVEKNESEERQLHQTENIGNIWVKSFLPQEITQTQTQLQKSRSKGTLCNLNLRTEPSSDSINLLGSLTAENEGFITQTKTSFPPMSPLLSPKKVRWNRPKLTSIEEIPDVSAAQRLADEVASNYRLYKEKANKNRELQQQMTEFLHYAGVLKIFLGKIYKKLNLSARIYLQLVENPDAVERPSLVENLDNSSTKLKRPPQIFLKPKINQAKFNLYKRINEKLQDANIEFKVQGLQTLENNLIQAHEDFKVQKMKAVKQLIYSGNQRMKEIISECYNTEEMIPMHQANPINVDEFNYDDLTLEGMPKGKKEIRMVSVRLTKVLKNWQQTLLNPA